MKEDLQNIDDIFLKVLSGHQETPSEHVWQQLNEGLNYIDTPIKSNSFKLLRRMIAVFILLFPFLILHECGFIKNGIRVSQIQEPPKNEIVPLLKDISSNTEKKSFSHDIENRGNTALQTINTPVSKWRNTDIPLNVSVFKNSMETFHGSDSESIKEPIDLTGKREPFSLQKEQAVINIQTKNADTAISKIETHLAKDKHNKNLFSPYWSVTAFGKREWTQYNLENDLLENSQNPDDRKAIAKRENHEPSYMLGMLASYQFKKQFAFQIGLEYSSTAISIEPQKVYAVKNDVGVVAYKYNTSSGYAYLNSLAGVQPLIGDSINTNAAQHTLEYISIPVMMQYNINKQRFSVGVGFGFGVNLLTSAKIQTEIKNTTGNETVDIKHLQGLKSFYTDVLANAEISYEVKKRWSVTLMPSWRYALSPINKNNVVKTYPYSFGLGTGVTFKF